MLYDTIEPRKEESVKFRIREARERAGYSQKELAEIIGVAQNTFHGYAPLSVFDISQSLLRSSQSFGPNIFLGLRGVLALGLGKDGALALDGV